MLFIPMIEVADVANSSEITHRIGLENILENQKLLLK